MTEDTRPDPAKRLEQARLRRKFKTARAATDYFGWNYNSYVQHESGVRGIGRIADQYAKGYRVSKGWLLTGEGDVGVKTILPVVGYVGAGAKIEPFDGDSGSEMLEEVEVDFPMPDGTAAAIVRGDSMLPVFEDGDLIGYHRDSQDPNSLIGRTCIVKVTDGPIYIKTLRRGRDKGLFTLSSFNSSEIEDVAIDWAAPFRFRISRDDWRRL